MPNDEDDLEPIPGVRAGLPAYAPPKQMWFGRVKYMFVHRRAVGDCEVPKTLVFYVDWHKFVPPPLGPFDVELQCPIAQRCVASELDNPYFPACTVLPIEIVGLKHPSNSQQLAMVSRTWQPLSAINMPVPWPNLVMY